MKVIYKTEVEFESIRLKSISKFIEDEKYIWLDNLTINQTLVYDISEFELFDLYRFVFINEEKSNLDIIQNKFHFLIKYVNLNNCIEFVTYSDSYRPYFQNTKILLDLFPNNGLKNLGNKPSNIQSFIRIFRNDINDTLKYRKENIKDINYNINTDKINNWNENFLCKNTIGDEPFIQYTIYPNSNFFKENSVIQYEGVDYTIIMKNISSRNEYLQLSTV